MRHCLAATVMMCLAGTASAQDLAAIFNPPGDVVPTAPPVDLTAKIAAFLGNPPNLELRKVQHFATNGEGTHWYCGQLLLDASKTRNREYQLFTYTRLSGSDSVRILGSNDLNGMKSGRKTIVWLKRAGCL